jgi:hypothetical protein
VKERNLKEKIALKIVEVYEGINNCVATVIYL